MGFAFSQRSAIENEVRRIARKQIDKALAECGEKDAPFDELVHRLRRHCKKLRGLVQLIKPHFKHHKTEDRAFRDAARALAGTRDAVVMVETFAALVDFDRKRKHGPTIQHGGALQDWLQDQVGPEPKKDEQTEILADFFRAFTAAGKRAKDCSLRADRRRARGDLSADAHGPDGGRERGDARGAA